MDKVVKNVKAVSADFWKANWAWERGGMRTMALSSLFTQYPTQEAALAGEEARKRPFGPGEADHAVIELRHYQRGVAPRCRKPDTHLVEEVQYVSDPAFTQF